MPTDSAIDAELAVNLKQAKTKSMFFALVIKGGSDGALVLSKTKTTPAQITAAKKKSAGCFGEDGRYIFETAKVPATSALQVVKTVAKYDPRGLGWTEGVSGVGQRNSQRHLRVRRLPVEEPPRDRRRGESVPESRIEKVARHGTRRNSQDMQAIAVKNNCGGDRRGLEPSAVVFPPSPFILRRPTGSAISEESCHA
jgi:hypothetical protein